VAKKKALCRAASGAFIRNLGWKRTALGYAQHKFHLGKDETKAALANLRLEHLWTEVSKRWERENSTELNPTDRPIWDELTLPMAEAVRKGEPVAKVPVPAFYSAFTNGGLVVSDWLDRLQADFSVIKLELLNPSAGAVTDEFLQEEGQRLMESGRRLLHKKAGGETLHAALTVYGKWIAEKFLDAERRVTQWGNTQGRHVTFLRKHLPDCSLVELDGHRIEELLDVLRLRPVGDGGRAVSVAWTRNVLKQFRHFLRWLNRSPEFAWRRPADLELGQVRIPLNPTEKGRLARSSQVETYTADELGALWEYAPPFQRLVMLLALNCGFGKAEVASLELSEVLIRARHPHERESGHTGCDTDSWVLRVRHKSDVYGEWKLWPETVRAIDWWLKRRAEIEVGPAISTLLVTSKGGRFDTATKGNHPNFQMANAWLNLAERVRKDQPAFRKLSFNKLRKTAGNLIRDEAGGEVAGVFLSHGNPVRADAQLDRYTNRPFARVFGAIERIGERLRPQWAKVPDPFPDVPIKKGGPNISLGTIRRIQELRGQGRKIAEIVKEVGLSRATVSRWADAAVAGEPPIRQKETK